MTQETNQDVDVEVRVNVFQSYFVAYIYQCHSISPILARDIPVHIAYP